MADDIVVTETQETEKTELAEMMAISLGQEPIKTDESVAENVTEVVENVQVPFQLIRDRFGFEKEEDVVAEIESLRAFKSQPQTEPIKFENDFSENLFKAIQAGNIKEVTQLLSQKEKLDSLTSSDVNDDTAEEIIKLGMQLEYGQGKTALTKAEIDYKFNKQYALPKEPIQLSDEDNEDFEQRKSEWQEKVNDIKMSRMIDAKMLIPKLENAKAQIQFPKIEESVDEGYAQYRKMLEEQPTIDAEVSAAYKSFTTKSIETKIPFNDETNKIGFEFQYEPDSETFTKSVDMALDINKFFEFFKKPDGTPDRQGFLNAIHFAVNKDKVILEAIKQAKNATLKSQLVDNSQGGNQQRFTPQTQELSELDKLMQSSVGQYMPQRRN